MSKNYSFDTFDIILLKSKNVLTIKYINKISQKVYQESFSKYKTDNFYEICFDAVETYFTKSKDNSTNNISNLEIIATDDSVNFNINSKFKLVLKLPFISYDLNDPNMMIKKLQNDIENNRIIQSLSPHSVFGNNDCVHFYQTYLPKLCHKITVTTHDSYYTNGIIKDDLLNKIFTIRCCECHDDMGPKLDPSFKDHICDTFVINYRMHDSDIEHIPHNIKKIVFQNCIQDDKNETNNSVLTVIMILQQNILNLETLELINFVDCVGLNALHIESTNLKKVILKNCASFPVLNKKISVKNIE